MDFENYREGQSMQIPQLFEANDFIYRKNKFETYVKSKDIDLWHIIVDGDYKHTVRNTSTSRDESVPYERQSDEHKKMTFSKDNEALLIFSSIFKMVLYNALPKKKYERVYEVVLAKDSELTKSKKEKYKLLALKVTTYNLPPWLCMKESSFMPTLLILGPKSPGKDIDVYLRPLIDDLKVLWALKGVKTIIVATGQKFNMRAMVLWTINDFPARSSLSG
ncbi:zf-CCHC domain-containing protein [Tanacetum coccineum]